MSLVFGSVLYRDRILIVASLTCALLSMAVLPCRAATTQISHPTINASGTVAGTIFLLGDGGLVLSSRIFVRTSSGTTTTYEVPGASVHLFSTINSRGMIVGAFLQGVEYRSFIRDPRGSFTLFDVPGAGFLGTYANCINSAGEVGGSYGDGNGVTHGFVRPIDGSFVTFNVGDAVGDGLVDTYVLAINSAGDVTGLYRIDRTSIPERWGGFIRTANGSITTFEVPGSHFTISNEILPARIVAGNSIHGAFLREANGSITTFPAELNAINSHRTSTGLSRDVNGVVHGFVRSPDGFIETFEAPGAGTERYLGTFPTSINARGEVVGFLWEEDGWQNHGFIRAPDGTMTRFDVPMAPAMPASRGESVRYYLPSEQTHGFMHARGGTISAFGTEHVRVVHAAESVEDRALVQQPVVGLAQAAIRGPSVVRRGGMAELEFSLPEAAEVSLVVYDVMGRGVATIEHGPRNAGAHRASWDASATAPGIYFYRLVAGSQTATRSVRVVP